MTSGRRAALGLVFGLSLFTFRAGAWQDPGVVVAEVSGDKLTLGDLEQRQASALLQARYQYYLAERKALDQLIDDHLLQAQARRENITVEQLLEREVTQKIKEPTEDQIEIYYEGLQTDKPYADMRAEVVKTIRQIRQNKLRSDYLKSLRSQASIEISLQSPKAEVSLEGVQMRGPKNASVVIVEFADYECPYCQQIHPQLKKLESDFEGKVAMAYRDFPLPMHPRARKAAEAARCAGAQGKFWDFHDLLFDTKKIEAAELKEDARTLHLDTAAFDKCLDSGEQAAAIQKDLTQGQHLGLTGTPSFFINGHFFSGAVSYDTLHNYVAQQLAAQPPASAGASRPQ